MIIGVVFLSFKCNLCSDHHRGALEAMVESDTASKKVAVIGAGISGVCSAAHLLKQGVDVVLFERSSIAGGVWHLDNLSAADPEYPNTVPSRGDYQERPPAQNQYLTPPRTPTPEQQSGGTVREGRLDDYDTQRIAHAPPGPCYAGLQNNVSLRAMKTTLGDWPAGLPDFVSQQYLEQYIQSIAETSGVSRVAQYNTRVEEVRKEEHSSQWTVRTTTLTANEHGKWNLDERHWHFDGVIVASGHYNMPRIPDIPGLNEWKARYPDRVMHSKSYRSPLPFKDKRVLIVGAGVSSTDIAKESEKFAKQVYQSSRGGALDIPPSMLPSNALRIGGVKSFIFEENTRSKTDPLAADEPLPGYIELNNGSKLRNIDHVVLGTGYLTSYPFLRQYHDDDTQPQDADEHTLVTGDGNMVHNLHKDIFFISDPTLAFVGQPYHISTFSLFEFQAQLVARVFAGRAKLPSEASMREEYRQRLARRPPGRDFHSLREEGDELAYVAELVRWANEDAAENGADPMLGHTEEFLAAHHEQREKLKGFGRIFQIGAKGQTFDHVKV